MKECNRFCSIEKYLICAELYRFSITQIDVLAKIIKQDNEESKRLSVDVRDKNAIIFFVAIQDIFRCYQYYQKSEEANIFENVNLYKNSLWDILTTSEIRNEIEITPQKAIIYFNEAVTANTPQKRIELYTKSLMYVPNYIKTYLNRALTYYKMKENWLGKIDFETAIKLCSNDTDRSIIYCNWGFAEYEMGQYQLAMKYYNIAIQLDDKNTTALTNRGVIGVFWKEFDLAISDYTKALNINPKHSNAHYNMACSYSLMGNKIQTFAFLKSAILIDEKYKSLAYEDTDFKWLLQDSDFSQMVSVC